MTKNITPDRKNRLFANIGKLITSTLDSDEILKRIMDEVKLYFSPLHWSLLRYDHTSELLYFAIVEGSDFDMLKNIKLKKGEGIAGTVVSTGQSIFVSDTSKDDRFTDKVDKEIGFRTESIIAVPIKIDNSVYGVIEIINLEEHKHFSDEDHLILQTIADFAAIAFANNHTYEKALQKSEVDSLTGLYNKEKLRQITETDRSELLSRREKDLENEVIVVFMDLDNFKDINDNFGHHEGDIVLQKVAVKLKSIFRMEDLVFRTGGDEFITVMYLKDNSSIEIISKRIRETLEQERITSIENGYSLSISYGIKSGDASDLSNIINEADIEMYKNKRKKNN